MSLHQIIKAQRDFFYTHQTKDVSFRLKQLETLKKIIIENESDIVSCLKKDLNKSEHEAYLTEIASLLSELNYTIKHLKKWVKPRKVRTPVTHFGGKSRIIPEPYGVVLIIAPWNYPFHLAVAPIIGAIAAGNCVVLKPSEFTPSTSRLLARLLQKEFDEEYITVIEGDATTSQQLLQEKFDYIFFTGSTHVGKIIMEAAAKHLTPVTLELGGKSPCIVAKDTDVELAAKRIVWGKFVNAGQTCVAPDYVLVHRDVAPDLVEKFKHYIDKLYGPEPMDNDEYTHIVNEKHFDRLTALLNDGKVAYGGRHNREKLVIEPTILTNISWSDSIMQDEIFGPLLPVIVFDSLDEVINKVQARPKPLALYIFSEDSTLQNRILHELSFGGGCINDTIYHLATPHLPFGGVGESGTGAYHGKGSFDIFSHEKSIFSQTTRFDIPFRYPTGKDSLKWIKKGLK
ncbi:aldehyde dehydrogenase [Bacillus sp. HMF5848]|uniref:aldehyde dehydrogenase n=1 Tax=Bacillus sp. HMF5848 TaxID=2495421 RepID=UPI000F79DC1B|nr:aldehyde dehydrogenase [Bacillus sp. HMF5848]RSK29014.1 aldehyde dehydrogenase [Bacillus sp. HMF5848]